ncbi:unnamed protein product [Adineta ricciae]|uniref:BLOC-1-related complex subunit 6 C-terminal helix domain-containing protein n=1 Tax=Adineta ricciae TaxID=249248 RepID=A0A814JFQ2_ADIRI|nr:unnamed protein product [Adineta ricciae]
MNCNDFCLLLNIDLNSRRIHRLLERRFKSNSNKHSFDFKSFAPEQPSNNAKVSRSFLRFQPKLTSPNDSEEYMSSDSDCSSDNDQEDEVYETEVSSSNDDDHLKKLAEWEPEKFQPVIETDNDDEEDQEENDTTQQTITTEDNQMDVSSEPPASSSQVEDLLVTYIHRPVKAEPMSYDEGIFDKPPQLDGHVDLPLITPSNPSNNNDTDRRLSEIIAKVAERACAQKKTIQIHQIPPKPCRIRRIDESRKKSSNPTPKKPRRSPQKPDRSKTQLHRDGKISKKPISRLLNTVMKSNGDAIRERDTRLPTVPVIHHKPSRILSINGVPSTAGKQLIDNSRCPQQLKIPPVLQKQKSVPDRPQKLSQQKEKSATDHMRLAQRRLNHLHEQEQHSTPSSSKEKIKQTSQTSKSIIQRSVSVPKSANLNVLNQQKMKTEIKKLKHLSTEPSKLEFRAKENILSKTKEKTVNNTNEINKQQSIFELLTSSMASTKTMTKRPSTYFDGCIVIDDDSEDETEHNRAMIEDDDIQEIERQQYSIAYDLHARQKHLDHIVHTPTMHVKWLFNLENLLLDHILICHENNRCPCMKSADKSHAMTCQDSANARAYHIDPSFISIIIINFIKTFLLRNSSTDQQEFSFVQFGVTSHLRYFLLDLPTYMHNEEQDLDDTCAKCHQYSLIINILFDLLFDLIDYDLCGRNEKLKYRSSLIEDDYFTRFLQSKITKKNPFHRIKLVIYFIELLGLHMNKCRKKKQFQFNQNENVLFHSIEQFIRHIIFSINNMINERISICFNVMELCLLFASERATRIRQMSLFLSELCQQDVNYVNMFLFDENLLVDIRLLLTNELISKKFHLKLISANEINQFCQHIQDTLIRKEEIDENGLLLFRSLLNSYADLIIEVKPIAEMYSDIIKQSVTLLHHHLELIKNKNSMADDERFESSISTLVNNEQSEDSITNEVSELIDNLLTQIECELSPSHSSGFTSFVVEDIVDKIRSTTLAQKQSSSTDDISSHSLSSSIVDVPSAQSSRSISPSQILNDANQIVLPIDKRLLDDIEIYSRELAEEFVKSVEQLTLSLHHMSATSVCCLQTYRDAVGEKLNETIETNIKTIYSFMAQAEQLSSQLAPIYELQKKIAYIKQLLDILSQSI